MSLSDKESLLVEEISRNPAATQRELAESARISLGMANSLLRKLVQRGSLKVQTVNKRPRYVLTSRGSAERARRSCQSAARSYAEFKRTASIVRANILEGYAEGLRSFVISAPPEVEDMIREALRNISLPETRYVFEPDLDKALNLADTVFSAFPADPRTGETGRVVSILEPPKPRLLAGRNSLN